MIIFKVVNYPKHQLYDTPNPEYFSTIKKALKFIEDYPKNDYNSVSKPIPIEVK